MSYPWPLEQWKPPNQDTDGFRAERDRCIDKVKSILGNTTPAIAVSGWGARQLPPFYMNEALALGACLAKNNFPLLTGGLGGAMHAVTKGYVEHNGPIAIGILPKDSLPRAQQIYGDQFDQVKFVETQLDAIDASGNHTHLGPNSRNHVLVYSADLVVCVPGEGGSIAEARMAKQWYEKTVVAFDTEAGGPKTAALN